MMAVKTGNDELVPVREALSAGATEYFLNATGAKISQDWRGEQVITVADAKRAVAAAKASEAENDRLHADYRAWLSQHEAERAQIWRNTYQKKLAEAMRAQVKSAQRLHDSGSDPAGEYGQGWAAGGCPPGLAPPCSLVLAPSSHSRDTAAARNFVRAVQQSIMTRCLDSAVRFGRGSGRRPPRARGRMSSARASM